VVVGGPPGPPDEAALSNKEAADARRGFLARLTDGARVPVLVYTVQLDPATRRSADLTVQPLRAGVSLSASLSISNPVIGSLGAASVTIEAGSHTGVTDFTPRSIGSTVISVATPKGFQTSANATELTVVVAR
jgi:anti-sigma factor RsiW